LFSHLTVAENIHAGGLSSTAGVSSTGQRFERSRRVLAQLGKIDPRRCVAAPPAQRHGEIAGPGYRCQTPDLDEPTAALTEPKRFRCSASSVNSRAAPASFTSHRLEEIFQIAIG
jgi:ABC-type sugar transport system ATPase subunit